MAAKKKPQETTSTHPSFVAAEEFRLPLLPLRDMVVFPGMMGPFIVGREASVEALSKSLTEHDKLIFLAAQRDPRIDEPEFDEMFALGVVAKVVQDIKLPNGNVRVMVRAKQRAEMKAIEDVEGAQYASGEAFTIDYPADDAVETYMVKVLEAFEQYAKVAQHATLEGVASTIEADTPAELADSLAAFLMVPTIEKQKLLEILNPYERLQRVHDLLEVEIEKANIDKRINVQVKKQMEKAQKEYYLNEKVKAIHEELGHKDDRASDVEKLREKIKKAGMHKDAREKAEQELKRLEAMPAVSAEATVSRNYIDWLVSVPWKKTSRENLDLERAQEVLDADHYGLEKIKERVLEFLAVRQLTKQTQSSILCFVGPPGVGKSSLAKSIARAMGRKFVRFSLGGVRDEAEIRGHRRTYIGAFPGQIIQLMKKAGKVNPVFLLDEVDKMSMDFRGDPSAALLEVLDPEQNDAFVDHYLDTEFDLSKVMFIATANVSHPIPPALKDRMEVIQLTGYTLNEKLEIARGFVIPKQLEAHGLGQEQLVFEDEALKVLIERYTREAGVRNLEREIARVCRKVARQIVEKTSDKKAREKITVSIGGDDVAEYLGPIKFRPWRQQNDPEVGVSIGLAWTEFGGEMLETEVSLVQGKGKLTLTGKLGEVMQESARAAASYTRRRCAELGRDPQFFDETDIHVHVPEGAIPKDGPSAGITMATALVSAVTKVAVRRDVAMTGEITLRGRVLPVGGIKHKLLAAYRNGIHEIILPSENKKDLEELPDEVRETLEIHLVETMDDVLRYALDGDLVSVTTSDASFGDSPSESPVDSGSVAH